MRPIKLKIKNLNSFIEEQTIDFEKLTSRGLFGIFGPTGSGKSTVLDGITLALYGNVARKSSNFINTNSDKMSVYFEFEMRGVNTKRYFVDREFKRKAKGAINAGKCKLVDITDKDNIEVLSDATKALNKKIEEIIGLNLEDFTRTVVLPQGKFSEFLKLEGKERREMLERLFNLQKYGDELSVKLFSKIANEKQENNVLLGELKGYEDISEEYLKEKTEHVKEINIKIEELDKEIKIIENKFKEAEELCKLQLELEDYKKQKNSLEEKKDFNDNLINKIKFGECALRVLPYINAFEETSQKLAQNKKELESLKLKLEEVVKQRELIEKEYEKAKISKEKEIPDLIAGEQRTTAAIEEKKELNNIIQNINKLKEECVSLEKQLKLNEESLKSIEKLYSEKEEFIKNSEQEYELLKVDEEVKQKVQNGLILEESRDNLENNLKRQEELQRRNEKSLSEITEKGKSIKASHAKIQDELASKKSSYEELLKKSPGEPKDLINLNMFISDSEYKWKIYNKCNSQIEEYKNNYKTYETKINENKEQLVSHEKLLEQLKQELDIANKEEISKRLREELKEGDICPVCGSTHHAIENLNTTVKSNSSEINIKIDEEDKIIQNIKNEITVYETKINSINENLETVQKEIESLGTKFREKSIEELKSQASKLEKDIDLYNKSKEELQNSINDLLIREKEERGNLNAVVSEYRVTESNLKNIKDEIAEVKEKLNKVNSSLELLKGEIKVDNFKNKNSEIIEKENKRSKLFRIIKDTRNNLKELEVEREELIKNINNANEKIAKDKTLLVEYEKNREDKTNNILKYVGTLDNLEEMLFEIKNKIQKINDIYDNVEKQKDLLENDYSKIKESNIVCENTNKDLSFRLETEKEKLDNEISKEDFMDIDDVKNNIVSSEILKKYKEDVERYKEEVSKVYGAIENIQKKINGRNITHEEFEEISKAKKNKIDESQIVNEERIKVLEEIKNIENKLKEQKDLLDKKKKLDYKLSLLSDLEKLFKGKRFVEFVASHRLKYVSIEASKRLKEITHGNYGLEVDENGRFIIRDYKNGGAARDASTLSGGETFLASLSLALALSAEIQLKGTAPLEFFFLDEGFGTLDDELLDVVMSSLERIHNDRLKIGIISHVESIKNRVPVKLIVTPAESGKGGTKTKIEIN